MANQLTSNITHTYAGREFVQSFFYEPQLEGKDLYNEFQFFPNVKGKINIYLPQALQKVLRADTSCGFSAAGTTTIDDKTLTVCDIKFNLEQCEDAFNATIFEEFRRSGTDINDLRGTVMDTIMQTQMSRMIREDNQKLLWFGDDADSDNFYGICDGFWRLLIDSSGSLGYSLDMSGNASIESGGTMASDGALEAFRDIWTNQPATLRNVPLADKRFYVTATVFDNYLETLEALGTDSGLQTLQDGRSQLRFRGVPVISMPEWDDALADAANPFQAEIGNNAILYTVPSNLAIGADVSSAEGQMISWYDMKDELIYSKGKWKQGVQYVHDAWTVIAI